MFLNLCVHKKDPIPDRQTNQLTNKNNNNLTITNKQTNRIEQQQQTCVKTILNLAVDDSQETSGKG